MMEAVRIIKSLGLRPRRTIRVALWGGEEQGLLGSRAYVAEHYGTESSPKPGHAKLAAYYNLDNGTGRIRGVWGQGNLGAMALFRQWSESVKDLGVDIIAPRSRRRHRPRVVRQRRPARFSVRAGTARVQLAVAPLEHGLRRPCAARGPDPAGRGRGRFRVVFGELAGETAAESGEVGDPVGAVSGGAGLVTAAGRSTPLRPFAGALLQAKRGALPAAAGREPLFAATACPDLG